MDEEGKSDWKVRVTVSEATEEQIDQLWACFQKCAEEMKLELEGTISEVGDEDEEEEDESSGGDDDQFKINFLQLLQ